MYESLFCYTGRFPPKCLACPYLGRGAELIIGRPRLDTLTAQAYIRDMNRLSREKRAAVVAALVEGNSLRSTARMTDVTITPAMEAGVSDHVWSLAEIVAC